MNDDLYAAWLTAGNNLQPAVAWVTGHWIWLAVAASATHTAVYAARRITRRRKRLPAAPDNVPPTDDDLLITCRRIARQPHTNPDPSRAAYRYLRQKGDQQ